MYHRGEGSKWEGVLNTADYFTSTNTRRPSFTLSEKLNIVWYWGHMPLRFLQQHD